MTTIEQKLWACRLPPSGVVRENDILAVSRELLATKVDIYTLDDMRMVLYSDSWKSYTLSLELPPDDIISSHKLLNDCIIHIGEKEMSGVPLLGAILSYYVKALNLNLEGTFALDLEFVVLENCHTPGRKPASDVAILYKLGQGKLQPRVLFEYKPEVHDDKNKVNNKVNGDQLIELLLQGHYCLETYKMASCLCCLTDMQVWHYFLLERFPRCVEFCHMVRDGSARMCMCIEVCDAPTLFSCQLCSVLYSEHVRTVCTYMVMQAMSIITTTLHLQHHLHSSCILGCSCWFSYVMQKLESVLYTLCHSLSHIPNEHHSAIW